MEEIINYIDLLKVEIDNNDNTLENLGQIELFFDNNDVNLEFDDIIYLLNNSKNLINIIDNFLKAKNNKKESYVKYIKKYIKNSILKEVIETYCSNFYSIEELYDYDDTSLECDSSLKQYFNDIKKFKVLTREEEHDLAVQAKNGSKQAKDKLIMSNAKLVISIAKGFRNRGLELVDLIQYGNIGLINAVEKFDPEKGYKLSTYALWWIRQSISRSIKNYGRTIRYPVHYNEQIYKVKKTITDLNIEFNRQPTIDEIAEKLDMSADKVRDFILIMGEIYSLDAPVADEDSSPLENFVPDTTDIQDEVCRKDEVNYILNIINRESFDSRLREIVKRRFGLDGYANQSLESISKDLGITRERVRQLEEKALKIIRIECAKDKRRAELNLDSQMQIPIKKMENKTPQDYKYSKYLFGIKSESIADKHWNKMYIFVRNYYSKYGTYYIPSSFKTLDGVLYNENGVEITGWLFEQLNNLDFDIISKEKKEALQEIGITSDSWTQIFMNFKHSIYGFEQNSDDIPQFIIEWFINQLRVLSSQSYNNKIISSRIKIFENLGIDFGWARIFIMCYDDIKNNKELNNSQKRWIRNQQLNYEIHRLEEYQYILLKDILNLNENMTLKRI